MDRSNGTRRAPAAAGRARPMSGAVIKLRTTQEYAAWVEGLAEANRTTVSALIDQVLAEYAFRKRHDPPPKRL